IYNHANGRDNLFVEKDNYRFFLDKYQHYIHPIADTFCYCLMPNHFHFLLRIRNEDELVDYFNKAPHLTGLEKPVRCGIGDNNSSNSLNNIISKQFSNFFNSYTKAF